MLLTLDVVVGPTSIDVASKCSRDCLIGKKRKKKVDRIVAWCNRALFSPRTRSALFTSDALPRGGCSQSAVESRGRRLTLFASNASCRRYRHRAAYTLCTCRYLFPPPDNVGLPHVRRIIEIILPATCADDPTKERGG